MALTGKELKQIGFTEGKALGLALNIVESNYADLYNAVTLTLLKQVVDNPSALLVMRY
ncbi:MAG: hypothetical protein WDO14_09035 [Bacteroidota bacterium]